MEPEISDGSLAAFDKLEEPVGGDIVSLIFTPEAARRWRLPGMIKRLVMSLPPKGFEGLIVVEQISPPKTLAIHSGDVLAVHKFIGIPEVDEAGVARIRLPKREA